MVRLILFSLEVIGFVLYSESWPFDFMWHLPCLFPSSSAESEVEVWLTAFILVTQTESGSWKYFLLS